MGTKMPQNCCAGHQCNCTLPMRDCDGRNQTLGKHPELLTPPGSPQGKYNAPLPLFLFLLRSSRTKFY